MVLESLGLGMGGGTVGIFLNVLAVILGFGVVGAFFYAISWYKKFDIKVEITDRASNQNKVYYDKARYITSKDGRHGWQFLKLKGPTGKAKIIKVPQSKYVDITKDGKKFLRVLITESDTVMPWHPNFNLDKEGNLNGVDTDVLDSDDRVALIHEIDSAKRNYGMSSWGELLTKAMPYIGILIVVIGGVVLYDTMGQTLVEVTEMSSRALEEYTRNSNSLAEALERIADLVEDGQSVEDVLDDVEVPN